MLVFSAICPHSPLLLPTIGKKHHPKLKKTLTAVKTLEENLYAAKPDTLIVFSPHGTSLPEAFSINLADSYETNLKEFGDLTTKAQFFSDGNLIADVQHFLHERNDVPLILTTEEFLDYGTAVPACLLTSHLPKISLIPFFHSGLSLKKHFEFGQILREEILKSRKRIGIIASADLSHRLTDKTPGGFSPEGKFFDEAVVKAIKDSDDKKLLALEEKMKEAKACGLKTIVMLMGLLEKINFSPELLSYEGPFGVGYLVVKFNLQ